MDDPPADPCETTSPACEGGQLDAGAEICVPDNPWPCSEFCAALNVWPTTFGTTTLQNPDEVISCTEAPDCTGCCAAGTVFTTSPCATVLEHTVDVVVLTVSPA